MHPFGYLVTMMPVVLLLAGCPASKKSGKESALSQKDKASVVSGNKLSSETLRNTSGVEYATKGCDGSEPCTCRGEIFYGSNALKKIGVGPESLAKGTPCLIGDFDGNGYADVAFLEPGEERARIQALLFDEVGLSATAPLPLRVKGLRVKKGKGKRALLVEDLPQGVHRAFVFESGVFQVVTGENR